MAENFINQQTVVDEPRILRRHFFDLFLPALWSLIMLFPLGVVAIIFSLTGIFPTPLIVFGLWIFGGLYVAFVVSFFMTEWIFWYQDAWLITEDRLIDIQIVSLFNRRMSQLSFNQIQDVRVEIQGYFQNIFNYGHIYVQSAGRQGFFQLSAIPRPAQIASEIADKSLISQKSASGEPEVRIIKPTQQLGELLVAENIISRDDLVAALQEQARTSKRLGQVLVERGKITREQLVRALSGQYKIPSIDLSRYDLDGQTVRLIPAALAQQHLAVAIDRSPDGVISLAMAQPSTEKVSELMSQIDAPLTFLVADEDYIKEVIRGYYTEDQPPASPTQLPPDLPPV